MKHTQTEDTRAEHTPPRQWPLWGGWRLLYWPMWRAVPLYSIRLLWRYRSFMAGPYELRHDQHPDGHFYCYCHGFSWLPCPTPFRCFVCRLLSNAERGLVKLLLAISRTTHRSR